ncbi:MAG: serine/threonine-protein kinase, partial [Thermoguttaceae bacterium]
MNEPNDQDDDQEILELLDDYLARLQAGVAPHREEMLREHPQLASALDCLEALEGLAPRSTDGGRDDQSETMAIEPPMDTAVEPAMGNLPREFGPYELLSEIGRGGMGVVYKARQTGLDRTVAIKMILSAHLASAEHVRRFQAEARAAARVRHPHIVPIHEVGQLHGQDYFAMELIEGESLAERIARGLLGVESAVRLLVAIARAVDHLHEQDIVHRDLKPSNILLDGEELPYVTDFGLAKVFAGDSQMTATGVIAGTPSYMAPEQASGNHGEIGPAVDVYSLGAILYELLTGRPPFRAETPLDTLLEVLGREPTLPRQLNSRIPRELELICLKCLAKSPDDRYGSAGAMADDLEHFARGETLEVRPPHAGQRLWRWARRQPALASRLGAFSVFYAIEMVNFHWRTGGVDEVFHWKISVLLAAWVLASLACQQFVDSIRWSIQ